MGMDIIKGNIPPELNSLIFAKNTLPSDGATTVQRTADVESTVKPGSIAEGKAIVNEAIEKLKSAGDIFNKRLDFRIDEKTNRVVVKVIDTKTDKVIKEIPPEQLLHLVARIQEMIGLLVDEER